MTRVSPRRRCSFSGSAAPPPDRKSGDRHEGRGHDTRFDHHPAAVVGGPDQITEQPNNIIGDGRDRETLHRGLQPELQPRARVHRFQEFLVLLLQFDVDAGAQQIGGARQLQRKTRLPFLDGDAGVNKRPKVALTQIR